MLGLVLLALAVSGLVSYSPAFATDTLDLSGLGESAMASAVAGTDGADSTDGTDSNTGNIWLETSGGRDVTVSWSAEVPLGAECVVVARSSSGAPGSYIQASPLLATTATTWTDRSVSSPGIYYYVVVAGFHDYSYTQITSIGMIYVP